MSTKFILQEVSYMDLTATALPRARPTLKKKKQYPCDPYGVRVKRKEPRLPAESR